MKKILFIPCGVGLGHATRTWAIIRKIKKKTEVKIASYGAGYDFFKDKDVEVGKIRGIEYNGGKNFNLLLTLAKGLNLPFRLVKSHMKLNRLINDFDPDIVFSDSDPSGFLAANLNQKENHMLTNLPIVLFEKENLPEPWKKKYKRQLKMIKMVRDSLLKYGDEIFVPSVKKYHGISQKFSLVNPIVRKERQELSTKEELKQKLGIERDFYLVSFPGSDIGKEILKEVLNQLKDLKEYFVVLNSEYNIEGKKNNMYFLPFVNNFLEYLKASEGIISLGGHSTMSEALAYQKPLLSFPIKNHIEQMVNADMLRREKLGMSYFGELRKGKLRKKLKKFFNVVPRIKKRLIKLNLKGKGASQVAKKLLS